MIPKYLYHYTSIDAIKEIVDSQKNRFTRLDLLNDPYEGIVDFEDIKEYPNINQKVIYCSCWTPETSESVILWTIYTKMKGVRIKVKSNLFSYNIDKYKAHPDCGKLICFVYDPEERIHNPVGIMNDLNKQHDGFAMVIIKPDV